MEVVAYLQIILSVALLRICVGFSCSKKPDKEMSYIVFYLCHALSLTLDLALPLKCFSYLASILFFQLPLPHPYWVIWLLATFDSQTFVRSSLFFWAGSSHPQFSLHLAIPSANHLLLLSFRSLPRMLQATLHDFIQYQRYHSLLVTYSSCYTTLLPQTSRNSIPYE